MKKRGEADTILFMGTYPPRECGIATFTRDLETAVGKRMASSGKTEIVAMNRNDVNIYNYPKKVKYEVNDTDLNDFIEVAEKINAREDVKVVCIQHEFGLFGGEWGDHLLMFLEKIEKPVIVTFHSVLPSPNDKLIRVVRGIGKKADEIVVMTESGVDILRNVYGLENKINVIPHGIPTTSFDDQTKAKEELGFSDKIILSSFGMVSQNKGYEYIIEAMPAVVKKFPNVLFLIVGETHPNIRKEFGEEYRNQLVEIIKKHKLEKHVKFYNKYLTLDEIIQYLKATDVYLCGGVNPDQITSGTLVYAMGCGRAVISTPFIHAKDVVQPQRGMLAKFENPKSFSEAILKMLENPEMRKSMETHAYHQTRYMTWPNVALRYCEMFKNYLNIESEEAKALPLINTAHLDKLTDRFGIIQFSNQSVPDPVSGYTLDDNARAMLVCAKHYEKFKEYKQLKLIRTYLNYMKYVQEKDGKLYNFVDKSKKVDYKQWSEDAQGRAIWALGYLIASPNIPSDFKREAKEIFSKAVNAAAEINSPRAISFTIQGLCSYNEVIGLSEIKEKICSFADKLVSLYEANSKDNWNWFEGYLTYGNSKLSEAMFHAYAATLKEKYLDVAKESLNFLMSETFKDNIFVPIGQKGWYEKGGQRQFYDQQPIEAAYMIEALILAYKTTKEEEYRQKAFQTFKWFTGENTLKQVVYNETTGGCHDGLGEQTININQGAESTLAYLLARLNMMDV